MSINEEPDFGQVDDRLRHVATRIRQWIGGVVGHGRVTALRFDPRKYLNEWNLTALTPFY